MRAVETFTARYRRGSVFFNSRICCLRNPSGGSGLSETGSLDRAKAALERRKKAEDGSGNAVLCRVEVTRPNPDSLIDELLKATNLEQSDLESAESKFHRLANKVATNEPNHWT